MDASPRTAGIAAATWSWKSVRAWATQHGIPALSPRTCQRALHRLGFVWKRPKRLLLKADADKRVAFVERYRTVLQEATALRAMSILIPLSPPVPRSYGACRRVGRLWA